MDAGRRDVIVKHPVTSSIGMLNFTRKANVFHDVLLLGSACKLNKFKKYDFYDMSIEST